jgi:hypothetical protein
VSWRLAPALALVLTLAEWGCGYHAVYGGAAGERLHVVQVRAPVADAVAADEVTSGVREELAQEGYLAAGEGYPRVEVEVTRLDEASDAVAAAAQARVPVARATQVAVVARAWLVRTAGGEHERDTGDVRALVAVGAVTANEATGPANASTVDALRHEDALRAAARQTGARLARRILGEPAPEVDLLDDREPAGPRR